MISKGSSVELLVAAFALVGSRLLFDFASASTFVYPNYDYGQALFGFILFGLTLLGVLSLFLIRLVRRRFVSAVLILAAVFLTFTIPETPNRYRWKFDVHKGDYIEAIRTDPLPYPKFKIFDSENRNASLGGGVIYDAFVYDELDNINLDPNMWSNNWRGNPGLAMPEVRWITAIPSDCPRRKESFGGHFYFVSMQCR